MRRKALGTRITQIIKSTRLIVPELIDPKSKNNQTSNTNKMRVTEILEPHKMKIQATKITKIRLLAILKRKTKVNPLKKLRRRPVSILSQRQQNTMKKMRSSNLKKRALLSPNLKIPPIKSNRL